MKNVLTIAENEFSMLARNPIVIIFGILMLVMAIINAAGFSSIVSDTNSSDHTGNLMAGISNFFWNFSALFAFLAMCIGITSVADERSKGSLRVLFGKPLYRRDVITGKFVGINLFMFLLIAFTLAIFISLMITLYAGPESIIDLSLRMLMFAVLLFINCSFTLGLVMCLGILLNKSEALVISLAFISFEWLTNIGSLPDSLGNLQLINPGYLYVYAMYMASGKLLNGSVPLDSWLSGSLPYIVLMVAEVILMVLVNCMLFNREEA
jgi:ABC-2 type transport system permease protein